MAFRWPDVAVDVEGETSQIRENVSPIAIVIHKRRVVNQSPSSLSLYSKSFLTEKTEREEKKGG